MGFVTSVDSRACQGPKKLMENIPNHSPRTHCIRCGECCLRSSPTLQAEDLSALAGGALERKNLMTIRKGEFITDPVDRAVGPAASEWVKVKEKKGSERGCIFYDGTEKACTIYKDRPLQCVALTCWDTREIMDVLRRPRLTRQDMVHDGVLLGLMEEHERRCSHAALLDHAVSIVSEGNKALERILDLLKFDHHLRPFVSERLKIPMDEMDFFFGRPLTETIVMFGLKVERQPDGAFFLTRLERNGVLE